MENETSSLNIKPGMATVRIIDEILVHNNADALELAVIGGWQCVVKKGEFKAGDLVIYIEADAWVPNALAPFLQKPNSAVRSYNGVEGNRLRHAKFRGELSQGLVVPVTDEINILFAGTFEFSYNARYLIEGDDVTEILNIQKWEKDIPASMSGKMRGNFPSEIPKTDQPRIQNINRNLESYIADGETFQVTEKLHGTSCTFYLDTDDEFHVCSRNIDLKDTEDNTYWEMAKELDIENKLRVNFADAGVAIQGEIIGPGINGNQYGRTKPEFYVFDIYSVEKKSYLAPKEVEFLSNEFSLLHVPVIARVKLSEISTDSRDLTKILLHRADGCSTLNVSKREGHVYKSETNPEHSFKVVSNDWLLSGGDEQ